MVYLRFYMMRKFFFCLFVFFSFNCVYAQEEIKMIKGSNGLYTIPCEVNGLRLRFILDTGASAVSLSLTEAEFMLKNGYLKKNDILGKANGFLASGEITENYVINLKQVKIGTKILKNVVATVNKGLSAPLLLGQSVLSQLGEWSIRDGYLVIKERSGNDFSKYTELDWKKRIEETDNNDGKWDESIRYLMPGVLANDYNTIIKVGEMLGTAYSCDLKIDLKDEAEIVEKLKQLADAKDKTAIFVLASYYEKSALNIENIDKARELYEKLIEDETLYLSPDNESAYIKLYDIYKKHYLQPQKAIEYLQKGAILNESTCIGYLFAFYEETEQTEELYHWAEKLSQICSGLSRNKALSRKAKCLIEGVGVEKDVAQGVQLLEQLVIKEDNSDEETVKILCSYYFSEKKFDQLKNCALKIIFQKFYRNFYLGCASYFNKDYVSARTYLKHTMDKDRGFYEYDKLGFGLCLLGQCYENGLGGKINYKNAEKCYKYASEECGFTGAYAYYGDFLSNDKIYKEPNYEVALGCYMQGANNNDAYCCYMVSQFYKNGIGTIKNSKESKYWLQKAKENGWIK